MAKKVETPSGTDVCCRRAQVAALLGISENEVEAMHGQELHPWQEKDRRWRYRPEEVARAILTRNAADPHSEGKVAAKAFTMFQQQANLATVVVETEQPTSTVKRLFAEYTELAGGMLLSDASVAALRAVVGAEPAATGEALVSAIAREVQRQYARGLEDGRAEVEDVSEIIDRKTGERRRLPP